MIPKPAYETPEAREALGNISHQKLYDLMNSGELASFKIGRRRLISHDALMAFIRRREEQSAVKSVAAVHGGDQTCSDM